MIDFARLGRIIEIALLIVGTMYATWLFLRPDPVPMLSNLRSIVCTPSRRLRGCGPEPVCPPEFERMPLHLPPQPNPVVGPDWDCLPE